MECRICHQPIQFVRGLHSGHKRQATEAVHESDLARVLTETRGEVVRPHPGAQRRLRQALEAQHNHVAGQPAGSTTVTGNDEPEPRNQEDIKQEHLAATGQTKLDEELEQYNSVSPELTAGDLDANWQRAESTGEETPGGHVATPDQDNPDEIGRAVGMEIQDNQELRTHEEIFAKRDRDRWELNRSSTDGDSI